MSLPILPEHLRLYPNPVILIWLLINGATVAVKVAMIYHLWRHTVPELKRRGSWGYFTVRAVVKDYQRRDHARLARVTCYLLAGMVALLTPPAHASAVRLGSYFVAAFIIFGVVGELIDAIEDYRYRHQWLTPMKLPVRPTKEA